MNRRKTEQQKRHIYFMVAGGIGTVFTSSFLVLAISSPSWIEETLPGTFKTGTGLWETCGCIRVDRDQQPEWIYATQAFCVMAAVLGGLHLILIAVGHLINFKKMPKYLAASLITVGIFNAVGVTVFGAHLAGTNTYVSASFGLGIAAIAFSLIGTYLYLREQYADDKIRRKDRYLMGDFR